MSAEDELVNRVPMDRRQFVKRLAVTTAFVTPVVASFSMSAGALEQSVAGAVTTNSRGGGYYYTRVSGTKVRKARKSQQP